MKKVAIIIERANIVLGGAERSVFELTTALSGLGIEVHILAAKGQQDAKNIHILCQQKPGKRVCFFTFEKALNAHLSENQYHLIHSVLPFEFADIYQPRGGAYAESIVRNAASYQNPVIEFYKRLTAAANYRRTILLRAERKLARRSDGPVIAAISQYVADRFKHHYGTDEKRIVIIPNGVKTDKQIEAGEAKRLRTQIFAELGLKEADKPVLFLFAANNFRLKGLGVLIKALAIGGKSDLSHRPYLLIAGSGNPRKYKNLAKRLGIANRIIFLGFQSNIQNSLAISDVAVLPTFYDPSSRYILEALAAGMPVITTKYNGAADLFVNNRHGKVIDTPENISALAEAIVNFTDTNNIQKASQAIAEDNIKEKISIGRAAKQLAELYESIIERKGLK